jgi:hypothetical protein
VLCMASYHLTPLCYNVQDKLVVLSLCNAALALVTGPAAVGGKHVPVAGNMIFDGQLQAWKVTPAQFRPLLAAVVKLNTELAALDPAWRHSCTELFLELQQALSACV